MHRSPGAPHIGTSHQNQLSGPRAYKSAHELERQRRLAARVPPELAAEVVRLFERGQRTATIAGLLRISVRTVRAVATVLGAQRPATAAQLPAETLAAISHAWENGERTSAIAHRVNLPVHGVRRAAQTVGAQRPRHYRTPLSPEALAVIDDMRSTGYSTSAIARNPLVMMPNHRVRAVAATYGIARPPRALRLVEQEVIAAVQASWAAHESTAAIGVKFGMPPYKVRAIAAALGLARTPAALRLPPDVLAKIKQWWSEGYGAADIAAHVTNPLRPMTARRVQEIAQTLGVSRPPAAVRRWSLETIDLIRELWRHNLRTSTIAHKAGMQPRQVRAVAAALGLKRQGASAPAAAAEKTR